MKILITGANGKLGSRLVEQLAPQHDLTLWVGASATHGTPMPLTDYTQVKSALTQATPELIIHTAAWTDVDGCARDPQKAQHINSISTHHLASVSGHLNIPMLYVSTNEVFDGNTRQPYTEYDITQPANPYGYSKWLGERALTQLNSRHYIVRTAWLFAHGGKNFIHAILNAVKANKSLRVVTDELGNPTYTDDLANAIVQLIASERYGTYHFVNEGVTSRYDFARYILDTCGYQDIQMQRISMSEWQRPSTPPRYGALHNMQGHSIGIQLPAWQDAVKRFLQKEGLTHE
jgi:dTDP-4-dehydrorhamnose reductase